MTEKTKEIIKAVTVEELTELKELQKNINNAALNLANIEIAKYELLNEHAALKARMQEFSLQLQKKYGEVNISLADGSISKISSQEPTTASVE